MIINPNLAAALQYIKNWSEDNIQPNSIDLTVKSVYDIKGALVLYASKEKARQLPQFLPSKPFDYNGTEVYKLSPGKRYQVEFKEKLDLPRDVCAITLVRSTMAKSGCTGENGLYDSGYNGSSGMMVSVQTESYIEVGACIAQIIFFEAESSRLYSGYYQGANEISQWGTR